jgi:phosphoglycolate phosphatase-like HAD superfamily hydrolase
MNLGKSVLLWDIDGTLLCIENSKLDKHTRAMNNILKSNCVGISDTSGMTDLQIIEESANENSIILNEKEVGAILQNLEMLSSIEIEDFPLVENLNITQTLEATSSMNFTNGLLTGNSMNRAIRKIESAGLTKFFDFSLSYFGDKAQNRIGLVQSCITSIGQENIKKIVIIGDSPRDIEAAKEFGIRVIAVATGKYSYQELFNFTPSLLLKDLKTDFDIFINYLENISK